MKFLFFASALAILSSASAHDVEEHQRRHIPIGSSAIHFTEQVDDALKLVVKGTNYKAEGSPIQKLIYKDNDKGGDKESNKGDKDKDDDNDRKGNKDKDDDDDRKGGGKDSSSSNDRKGGKSSSSSSNDKKRSSSSSSSSGDSGSIASDICDLGHNACDHANEKKKRKGDDELATKLECDIACSTLCSHADREHMGCAPLSSTSSVVALKGASGAAFSPIQELIYKDSDGGKDDKDKDDKNDDSSDDRKGGGGNGKSSSSSNDRKGGKSSSSSSSKDRKGGSSSSGESLCPTDLDCGPGTTTPALVCNAACGDESDCTGEEKDIMGCPDDAVKYIKAPQDSSSSSSSGDSCDDKDLDCSPTPPGTRGGLSFEMKSDQAECNELCGEKSPCKDSEKVKLNCPGTGTPSTSAPGYALNLIGKKSLLSLGASCGNNDQCDSGCCMVGAGSSGKTCRPHGQCNSHEDSLTYVLKGQNYIKKAEEDDAEDSKASEDSKDDKNASNKSSSSSSSSKSSGGTSSTGNSAASADGGGVCDVDCTPGPDRPVGCGELCKVCTNPLPVGCPPNPPSSFAVKNLRGLKND